MIDKEGQTKQNRIACKLRALLLPRPSYQILLFMRQRSTRRVQVVISDMYILCAFFASDVPSIPHVLGHICEDGIGRVVRCVESPYPP